MLRWFACLVLVLSVVSLGWAKEKVTLKSLLAKSDAIYYSPVSHNLTDLAVEISVEQLAKDPVGKDAVVHYYYAGDEHQRMSVANVPDKQAAFRTALLDLLTPLGQYIVPRAASTSFSGMTLKLTTVSRQMLNVKDTTFYQIIGAVPGDQGDLKEYRVLVDKNGLVYQIENVYKNGKVTAEVENVKTKDGKEWLFTALYTRMSTKDGDLWKTERVEYDVVEGYTLPVKCAVQFRDMYNKPVSGREDLVIHFKNYQLNKGVATKAITEMEKKPEAAPTP
jgi:hypothetical protein